MVEALLVVGSFVCGVLFAAYRLRGALSMKQSLKMVIQGGGGPGEELEP